MSKEIFEIEIDDKDILIYGPSSLFIRIDYDDVPHNKILKAANKMVEILNDNWNKKS
jgi:hypothetical protein